MKQVIILALFLSIVSCTNSSNPTHSCYLPADTLETLITDNGYTVYVNNEIGFSLSYPSHWDTTNRDSRVSFMALENDPDPTDKFNEGLNVLIFNNQGMTLSAIVDTNIQFAKRQNVNVEIRKKLSKNKNGVDCIVLQTTQERQGLMFISYSANFVNGTNLFTLTQTFEASKKDKYEAIANTVIDSFNWTTH